MFYKRLFFLTGVWCLLIFTGCVADKYYQKGKEAVSGIIPKHVDEELYKQVPEDKKASVDPLIQSVREARQELELADALVKQKDAELDLEKAKRKMAELQLSISEAKLNLGKMKAVQSAGLGEPKEINKQVANLEAKVYKLKGEEARQKADVENAKLAVREAQARVEGIKSKTD